MLRVVLLAVCLLGVACAPITKAEKDAAADQLVSETVALMDRAEAAKDPTVRLHLLQKSRVTVEFMLDRYPETEAVRRIVTEGTVGDMSAASIRAMARKLEEKFREQRCFAAPSSKCLFDEALAIVEGMEGYTSKHAAYTRIAEAKARIGDEAGALAIARLVRHRGLRAQLLADVGKELVVSGFVAQGKRALAKARIMADGARPWNLFRVLRRAAESFLVLNDLHAANAALMRASDAMRAMESANGQRHEIARMLAAAGNLAGARRLLQEARDGLRGAAGGSAKYDRLGLRKSAGEIAFCPCPNGGYDQRPGHHQRDGGRVGS